MNERKQIDHESQQLAYWLQQVLMTPAAPALSEDENAAYHPEFYRQLPDFVMALLENRPQATLHYAPLLYHLVGCETCRNAYIDLYAALQAALQLDGAGGTQAGQGAGTPPHLVAYLCQSLIQRAEALYRRSRHEHTDESGAGRHLLQQALLISAHITQGNLRGQALHDLIRVANLFSVPGPSVEQEPPTHSYSPVLAGGALRGVETTLRPAGSTVGHDAIYLQSDVLKGSITQHDGRLELHLQDLERTLRGKYLTISVPLGSLIDPIRWLGGNPRTIRSVDSVDEHGILHTPLGETELRLSEPDDRNLLEVTFHLLEVRTAD